MIVTDDLGRHVPLPTQPSRIVSLAPSMTENLFAIGAGRLVVGVTTADDFPPVVKQLPRIGDFYQPLTERIQTLRPDLVLVESATVHRADMDNLSERLRAPVYAASSRRFADVNRQLARLGEITGHVREAAEVTAGITVKANAVARRIARIKPVTVLVQIDPTSLYAAGPGSFIDDLIRLAGGMNIVRGSNPFPLVSKEAIFAADPAFYIFTIPQMPGARPIAPPAVDPSLRALTAVREGRVRAIDANLLTRPTARLADGLVTLAAILHP